MGGKAVITTALSALVEAPPSQVWRAITDPAEVVSWDEPVLALLDPADGYPRVGRRVCWRYHLGTVQILAHDEPLEVVDGERLRSAVALGPFRFDQTWSLAPDGGPGRTQLGLRLASANVIPTLGGSFDRFDVRRLAAEYIDSKLRSLRRWCESQV
jgi:uncharacterized protein YndB with AHSA1/START domain